MKNQPTVVVLAAGRGERFLAAGGLTHKLQALIAGRTVLQHTLDAATEAGLPIHVVQASPQLFTMGDSIVSGIEATPDSPGWLLLPADLPLVRPATLLAVAQALSDGAQTVRPRFSGQVGHPVGFGASLRGSLLGLRGFPGAAAVFSSSDAIILEVDDEGCVLDVDTPDALKRAAAVYQQRWEEVSGERPI